MTWRDLLTKKLPPPAKPSPPVTNHTVQIQCPAVPAAPPAPPPAVGVIGIGATTGRRSPSPSRATSNSSGFFVPPKLPPSPRSLERKRQEVAKAKESASAIAQGATVPRTKSGKETWVPPLSPTRSNGNSEKRTHTRTWSIEQKDSYSIALSPLKDGTRVPFEIGSSPNSQEVRLRFSRDFMDGIEKLDEERRKDLSLRYIQTNPQSEPTNGGMKVFVRKRPLSHNEGEARDYDVVRLEGTKRGTAVVVYNTKIQPDLRTRIIEPVIFEAVDGFDEMTGHLDVYQKCAKSLVETAKSGGIATLLVYGQSGSGKSVTMSAMEGLAARDIFTGLPYDHTVKVTMLELRGPQCKDLQDEALSPVRIVENNDGSVRFVNALSVAVSTPEELLELIVTAKGRKQHPTKDKMSRNDLGWHVVCRITVVPPPDAPACIRRGTLTLVDCAGNEKRNNSAINPSIGALKRCIHRAKHSGGVIGKVNDIPYSHSNLTKVLRESFEKEEATFHVIATLSPKATDTEHTLETLNTVSHLIGGCAEEIFMLEVDQSTSMSSNDDVLVHPKGWDNSKLCDWLSRKHLIQDINSVPNDMTGRTIMRMTKVELQRVFFPNDFNKADRLYRCLRAESDRVARLELKRRMALERSSRQQTK